MSENKDSNDNSTSVAYVQIDINPTSQNLLQQSLPSSNTQTNPITSNTNTSYINLSHQTPSIENFPAYDYGFRESLLFKQSWLSPEQAAWKFHVPFFGRLRVLKDVIGILAMFTIIFYWFLNLCVHVLHILVPAYNHGFGSVWVIVALVTFGFLSLFSILRSSTKDPGALNTLNSPDETWNTCLKCNKVRPPQAHHCRKCGQCVRKMDHHCPWINNCVGEDNRYVFMLLLIYASIMATITTSLDVMVIYGFFPCIGCYERNYILFGMTTVLKFSFVSSFILSIAGAGMLTAQHLSILLQTPTMEMNRMQMQMIFEGKYPTTIPKITNDLRGEYWKVCGVGWWGCWPNPCRKWKRAGEWDDFHV